MLATESAYSIPAFLIDSAASLEADPSLSCICLISSSDLASPVSSLGLPLASSSTPFLIESNAANSSFFICSGKFCVCCSRAALIALAVFPNSSFCPLFLEDPAAAVRLAILATSAFNIFSTSEADCSRCFFSAREIPAALGSNIPLATRLLVSCLSIGVKANGFARTIASLDRTCPISALPPKALLKLLKESSRLFNLKEIELILWLKALVRMPKVSVSCLIALLEVSIALLKSIVF